MSALTDVQYARRQLQGARIFNRKATDIVDDMFDIVDRARRALDALDRAAESLAMREAGDSVINDMNNLAIDSAQQMVNVLSQKK